MESTISIEGGIFERGLEVQKVVSDAAGIKVSGGVFAEDVVKYTVDAKCSIKTADSKYEVKDCPQATNFYTSNNNPIPVVLDGTGIKINETKAVLNKLVAKSPVLASSVEIQILSGLNSVNNIVEVKEVAGEKLLFLNMATT